MKKVIVLVLVIVLLVSIHGELLAKEKRGAELLIQKKDGEEVRGELIAVKQNSLLLLDSVLKTDVSVHIGGIKVIIIMQKSKAVGGLLIGGALGALLGYMSYQPSVGFTIDFGRGGTTLVAGLMGGGIGAAIGALLGIDEKIQIEGKSAGEIRGTLEHLRQKARIPLSTISQN